MKSAADPYELFRWKSSCGRLVVRTTWVKGVRHVVLSDDDDDKQSRPEKERPPRRPHRKNAVVETPAVATDRPPLSPVVTNRGESGDDDYVERVLRWLHKPSGALDARRKPMSAPPVGNDAACCRRPALVKTCSIPENKLDDRGALEIAVYNERPSKSIKNRAKNQHKTELHVHMPSVCHTGKIVDDGYL